MELSINIDRATCIKCGRCVRVCPSAVFRQESPRDDVEIKSEQNCIVCGHCVAACPAGSMLHSAFPAGKVHEIDTSLLPSPEQVMLLCRSRRSNRAFSGEPVPEEYLAQILEAARRAPTASNLQRVEFTLLTLPAQLKKVAGYTTDIFASAVRMLQNPFLKLLLKPFMPKVYKQIPRLKGLIDQYEAGHDRILRGATAVIFIHTPSHLDFGPQDCNLAYQNGSLMAESLGVAHFYTGFVAGPYARTERTAWPPNWA